MTYKKDDILIFMTNEPMAHACEIVGEPMDKSEIEKEEYYGFVKSVISHKDGIYLMHTIKPLREIICIAEAADIIRKVDPSEMPENERERPRCEWTEAPNVFIPAQNEAYEKLTDEERCFALAKEALNAHCPEMEIVSMDLKTDWFAKSGKIADMDFLDKSIELITNAAKREELLNLKKEITDYMQTKRFKEYFSVNVGTPCEEDQEYLFFPEKKGELKPVGRGTSYFLVAVSKEFDEVCILHNITDRTKFFRSLGPEFDDVEHAFAYYRNKVFNMDN